MFKKILVPVDFSETARGAFLYAVRAAKEWQSSVVHVVHVFTPEVPGDATVFPNIEAFLEVKERSLHEFAKGIEVPDGLQLTTQLEIGFPSDVLANISDEFDLIIMGTTGASDWLNRILGSVSVAVAQRARCPVLLIPKQKTFSPLSNIVFACDIQMMDEDVVSLIKAINTDLKASLHFVHVRQPGETSNTFEETKVNLIEGLLSKKEPPFDFEVMEVEGSNIAESVSQVAHEKDADAVAMITKHRGLWEQLFHKSQTRQIALHTSIPLMVFHTGD